MNSHQFAAANTAIKRKAVLGGVWIEKSEIGAPGEFDHLSDDELERACIAVAQATLALATSLNLRAQVLISAQAN